MWSEAKEQARQAIVRDWLNTACSRVDWEPESLAKFQSLLDAVPLSEAIVALIEVGDQKPRPSDFWEAVRNAAELLWLDHPWATSYSELVRRTDYLVGLRNRIKAANGDLDYFS